MAAANPLTRARRKTMVSVIVPAFNAARFIAATLESVRVQTVRDFEVIIVDDGSTDGTARVAQQFATRDERFRVITQPNGGSSSARNAAMACATGEFFALLDSDDIWKPNYLAEQLRILHDPRLDADVVSSNAINLGGERDGIPWKPVEPGLYPVSLLELILVEDSVCIMSVFRRRVYERIGEFDSALCGNEDYDYWIRAAARGCRIIFNGAPLGYYRRWPGSLSANEARMLGGIQKPLKKLLVSGAPDSVEAKAIRAQLHRFETRRLMCLAKDALRARNLLEASGQFRALAIHTGSISHRIMAWTADWIPEPLAWLYSLKRAVRL